MAEAYAMVCLVQAGFASRVEAARAFGCSSRTVRRHLRRYTLEGMAGLDVRAGRKAGECRLSGQRLAVISRLRASGISNREIARQLEVAEKAIRKVIRRWVAPQEKIEQLFLPGMQPRPEEASNPSVKGTTISESSAPMARGPDLPATQNASRSFDTDPTHRWMDRLLACMGLLEDAEPFFRSGERIPRAVVLLALPPLISSGIFSVAKEVYADLAPAFYGLRTTILVLLFTALLRIKRPENVKEHSPPDLGAIFGLDRGPEVKTIRRKLDRMAKARKAERFGQLLARHRVAARGRTLGFLYIDGHVRVYHGKHRLPKAHVAQMRLSLPATTDYWVNDKRGDPIFVVTAEANAGLVKMLASLTKEIRALVGRRRRVTIVFDRGGWSPKLFKRLIADGFDILTYRKEPIRRKAGAFRLHRGRIDGRRIEYDLDDRNIRLLGGSLSLRQVSRLTEKSHVTTIVTSRRDLPALHVAYRMFNRWRQENFFKYLREEYLIDALVDYAVEPDDPERMVPNPALRKLDDRLREASEKLREMQQKYGAAALENPEKRCPTMRGFKITHAALGRAIRVLEQRVQFLREKKKSLPSHVPVSQARPGEIVKLSTERKHLSDIIKMVAYQAESDLLALLRPNYARADDEGRTLIQSALMCTAELQVKEKTLHVILDPLSSSHRTRAIEALCRGLNNTAAQYPGTHLRLHYEVRGGHPGAAFRNKKWTN